MRTTRRPPEQYDLEKHPHNKHYRLSFNLQTNKLAKWLDKFAFCETFLYLQSEKHQGFNQKSTLESPLVLTGIHLVCTNAAPTWWLIMPSIWWDM